MCEACADTRGGAGIARVPADGQADCGTGRSVGIRRRADGHAIAITVPVPSVESGGIASEDLAKIAEEQRRHSAQRRWAALRAAWTERSPGTQAARVLDAACDSRASR